MGEVQVGVLMIRKGLPTDVEFCYNLTVIEGWGYTEREIHIMAANSGTIFYIAEERGERQGMAASFQYGDTAWIGLVIVSKEYRGQGVGTNLMKEALRTLELSGVTTVRLEAVPEAVSLYKTLGFTPEFDSLRLRGEFDAKGIGKSTSDALEKLSELSEFDSHYFGVNRKEYLEGFITLSSVQLTENRDCLKGYLLGRTLAPHQHKIGPCVCEDSGTFESLLTHALSQVEGSISVGVPACNREGVSLYEQYGFSITGSSLRMVRGKGFAGIPEHVYAIGGPEKG